MRRRTRQILRTIFGLVGSLFSLAGAGTLTLFIVLHPTGDHSDAIRGGFIYLIIAVISFGTVWRLRPPADELLQSQGFEVLPTDEKSQKK